MSKGFHFVDTFQFFSLVFMLVFTTQNLLNLAIGYDYSSTYVTQSISLCSSFMKLTVGELPSISLYSSCYVRPCLELSLSTLLSLGLHKNALIFSVKCPYSLHIRLYGHFTEKKWTHFVYHSWFQAKANLDNMESTINSSTSSIQSC